MPKGVPNKKYAPEFNTDRIYLRESPKGLAIQRPSKEAAESGGRGFTGWSTATASRERIPEKLASFGFGRTSKASAEHPGSSKTEAKTQAEDFLSIAHLPRATFFSHLKRIDRLDKYETEKAEVTAIYHENKECYGYRWTARLLRIFSSIRSLTACSEHDNDYARQGFGEDTGQNRSDSPFRPGLALLSGHEQDWTS